MTIKKESCILINNLSIQIEINKLNKLINTQVGEVFAGRGPIVINVLNDQEILITPIANVNLHVNNNLIEGTIPVHVNTNLNVPVRKVKVEANIVVHFKAELSIVNNNNFSLVSNITDIEWIDGIDISPPLLDFIIPDSKVQEMVEKQLPTINEKLNEALQEALNLNTLLAKTVWHKIIKIPLKEEEAMYLSVKPEQVEIYKIDFSNGLMKLSINTKVLVTPAEELERPDTKFQPTIIFLDSVVESKSLYIEVRLDLESLDSPAMKVIKSIKSVEKAIGCTIEKILVRAVGDDGVAIALKLKGALNGGLSIAGNPQMSQQDLMLDIENLTFNFSGKNILSSLKGNIALSVAKSVIRKQFPIALKPYIENLIETLNEMISSLKLANGLFLKGNIHEWKLVKMDIVTGFAVMIVQSDLTMELTSEK